MPPIYSVFLRQSSPVIALFGTFWYFLGHLFGHLRDFAAGFSHNQLPYFVPIVGTFVFRVRLGLVANVERQPQEATMAGKRKGKGNDMAGPKKGGGDLQTVSNGQAAEERPSPTPTAASKRQKRDVSRPSSSMRQRAPKEQEQVNATQNSDKSRNPEDIDSSDDSDSETRSAVSNDDPEGDEMERQLAELNNSKAHKEAIDLDKTTSHGRSKSEQNSEKQKAAQSTTNKRKKTPAPSSRASSESASDEEGNSKDDDIKERASTKATAKEHASTTQKSSTHKSLLDDAPAKSTRSAKRKRDEDKDDDDDADEDEEGPADGKTPTKSSTKRSKNDKEVTKALMSDLPDEDGDQEPLFPAPPYRHPAYVFLWSHVLTYFWPHWSNKQRQNFAMDFESKTKFKSHPQKMPTLSGVNVGRYPCFVNLCLGFAIFGPVNKVSGFQETKDKFKALLPKINRNRLLGWEFLTDDVAKSWDIDELRNGSVDANRYVNELSFVLDKRNETFTVPQWLRSKLDAATAPSSTPLTVDKTQNKTKAQGATSGDSPDHQNDSEDVAQLSSSLHGEGSQGKKGGKDTRHKRKASSSKTAVQE